MSLERNRYLAGQEYAVGLFLTARRKDRLGHTYCIAGPKGVGKRIFALEAAKSLLCNGGGPDACDECAACSRAERRVHPDLSWVEPAEQKRAILKEQVQELQDSLALKPLEGAYKAAVICEANVMQEVAANSLLKTLEEPPAHSVLFLTSVDPTSLLPTIASRCQIIRLVRLRREQAATALRDLTGAQKERAALMAALADGRLSLAQSMGKEESARLRELALQALSGRTGVHIMDSRREILEKLGLSRRELQAVRDALRQLFEYGLFYYRDLLARRLGAGEAMLYNQDKLKEVEAASGDADIEALLDAVELFFRTSNLVDQNVNTALVTEHLTQKLAAARSRIRAGEP